MNKLVIICYVFFSCPQIWRLVTCVFFYPINPATGFHFMLNCYFLYNYSLRLENDHFKGSPADYCFLLLFNWFCCILVGLFFDLQVSTKMPFEALFIAPHNSEWIINNTMSVYSFSWIHWFYPFCIFGANWTKMWLSISGSAPVSRPCTYHGYYWHSIWFCRIAARSHWSAFWLGICITSWKSNIHKNWAAHHIWKHHQYCK